MISDDELARELKQALTSHPSWRKEDWLQVARRARELLLPKEEQDLISVVLKRLSPDGRWLLGDATEVVEAAVKVRAYRAAQQPKLPWTHHGPVIEGPGIKISLAQVSGGSFEEAGKRICDALNRESK